MSGKWHVGMHSKDKWPLQRGFDKYYGVLSGGSSYLRPFPPRGITVNNEDPTYDFPKEYYTTDAFTSNAIDFIKQQKDSNPFFLYLAYNAPHWPLQAKPEDLKPFLGKYDIGWDSIRHERLRKQIALGVVKPGQELAAREMRPWDQLTAQEKKDVAFRMSVYAAQVSNMDKNIGKLLATLRKENKLDNTLILFLSDNGAAAEPYEELGGKGQEEVNDPNKFWAVSYGMGWANTSNTPFRRFKVETYEGGIATPFIAHWPEAIKSQAGKWNSTPYYLIDIMSTLTDVAGATYPKQYKSNKIIVNDGISMKPVFLTGKGKTHEYMYWEHQNNCAIRWGDWKAVKKISDANWQLYNLSDDREELIDLAAKHPDLVKKLDEKWQKWAISSFVLPKGDVKKVY
jgi:arylsulfatase